MYDITLYGTDTNLTITSGQVAKSTLLGASPSSYTTKGYTLEPFDIFDGDVIIGAGGYKNGSSLLRDTFKPKLKEVSASGLKTARDSLNAVLSKEYKFMEITNYSETLCTTANVFAVVILSYEWKPIGKAYLCELEIEGVVPKNY